MSNVNDLVITLTSLIEAIVEEKLASSTFAKPEPEEVDYGDHLSQIDMDAILDEVRNNYDPSEYLDMSSIVRDEVSNLTFEVTVY